MLSINLYVCETLADRAYAAEELSALAELGDLLTLDTTGASGVRLICALSRTTATLSSHTATDTELADLLTTGLDLLSASDMQGLTH